MKELEGVLCHLLRCGLLLALGSWSHHAGLEEDPFEHHIVLLEVEEDLTPDFLRHLEGPLDPVIAVEKDFRLHDRDETIVLQTISVLLPKLRCSMNHQSIHRIQT